MIKLAEEQSSSFGILKKGTGLVLKAAKAALMVAGGVSILKYFSEAKEKNEQVSLSDTTSKNTEKLTEESVDAVIAPKLNTLSESEASDDNYFYSL